MSLTMNELIFVGLFGGPASGKSTLAHFLADELGAFGIPTCVTTTPAAPRGFEYGVVLVDGGGITSLMNVPADTYTENLPQTLLTALQQDADLFDRTYLLERDFIPAGMANLAYALGLDRMLSQAMVRARLPFDRVSGTLLERTAAILADLRSDLALAGPAEFAAVGRFI